MAGSRLQIQAALDADVVESLVQLARWDASTARREAAWAIANATAGGSPDQVEVLVQAGAIGALHSLLSTTATAALVGLGVSACWPAPPCEVAPYFAATPCPPIFYCSPSQVTGLESILRAGDLKFGYGAANVWAHACFSAGVHASLKEVATEISFRECSCCSFAWRTARTLRRTANKGG